MVDWWIYGSQAALSLPRAACSAGFTMVPLALKPCMNVVCPCRPHLLSRLYSIAAYNVQQRYSSSWNLTWARGSVGQREQGIKRNAFRNETAICRTKPHSSFPVSSSNQSTPIHSSMFLLASLASRLVHVTVDERGHLSTNVHHRDLPRSLVLGLACFAS